MNSFANIAKYFLSSDFYHINIVNNGCQTGNKIEGKTQNNAGGAGL